MSRSGVSLRFILFSLIDFEINQHIVNLGEKKCLTKRYFGTRSRLKSHIDHGKVTKIWKASYLKKTEFKTLINVRAVHPWHREIFLDTSNVLFFVALLRRRCKFIFPAVFHGELIARDFAARKRDCKNTDKEWTKTKVRSIYATGQLAYGCFMYAESSEFLVAALRKNTNFNVTHTTHDTRTHTCTRICNINLYRPYININTNGRSSQTNSSVYPKNIILLTMT